jgi:glutathione peroxidase
MVDRQRRMLLLGGAATMIAPAASEAGAPLAWNFSFPSIEDGTIALSDFRDRVLLVVNTASFCGFTYQFEALENLHQTLAPKGLVVLGVPSQDFNQESSSNSAVKQFCEASFGVDFPMAGISHVRGAAAHPFYQWVKLQRHWGPGWNFNKVLISRDGTIQGTYGSSDEPTGSRLRGAIDGALAPA